MTTQAKIAVLTLFLTGLCLASPQKQKKSKASAQKAQPVTTAPIQAAPAPPQPPPTPEQMPPKAAKVTLSNGMLTIIADNSTMADVLNGIHRATGATIDAPPSAGSERVAVNIGPADPRDALQELFTGSKFDYILVGSPEDDLKLQRVILTFRSGGPAGSAVANNNPGYRPPQPTGYQPPPDTGQDSVEDEAVYNAPEPASPEQIPNMPVAGQPEQVGSGADQNQNQNEAQGQEQQQKTPEQLLQELQRIQRQQRGDQPATPQPR